ncbi:TetR/AcrR family transcriptional regulator [Streptomyces sp. FH025]|uniref:TetR/AcrR family transcriptional regulator n=1 Tax=Streptomyces sp. FH025 TaxID=2815937 RepID=UPI001A9E1D99|nr:TetR family transcriptional regulator [Streptomyces sp. FH025]MBO1414545.1 TetR/AcrR family transcriptional regulator [Streptomyces sp. FH025]
MNPEQATQTPDARLPLRERKKLRTRQALIDTALELFGEHGFDGVTLDQLCDAVEVSKRTFFRTFSSKEDVAMAPTQDLWAAFLTALENRPADGHRLLALYEQALTEAIGRMPADGWAERALVSRRLAARTPSMDAHGLAFCDRVTQEAVAVTGRRFTLDGPADLRARLALDMLVSAFRLALAAWVEQPSGHTREDLARRLRAACAELPGALAATAEPRD